MTKRLFIAIKYKPSEEIKEIIHALKDELINEIINWVDLQNIHLTLKFLGDTKQELIPKITDGLRYLSTHVMPFNLKVIGTGAFFRGKLPSVLFLKTAQNENLIRLAHEISVVVCKFGFPIENRKFKSHLTLARVKLINDIEQFNELLKIECKQTFSVDSFALIESKLTQRGPIYNVVDEFNIK